MMTRFQLPTAWRAVAVLGLLLLAVRAAPADEAGDRVAPVEAALRAGNRAEADRLSGRLGEQTQNAGQVTVKDAMLLRRVWRLYAAWGYSGKAEEFARKTVSACERLSPPNPFALIQANIELGQVYRLEEDYVRAGGQYQECRRLLTLHQSTEFPWLRWLLQNNVGKLCELSGRYDPAEEAYTDALRILDGTTWEAGAAAKQARLDRATTLNNLGWLYHAEGKYEKARAYVEEAKTIREKDLPADDDAVAESFNNLGLCLFSLGRSAEAKPLIQRAVDILRKKHGADYPQAAGMEHNLAALCAARKEFPEALRLHEDSIAVLERALGKNHPDVAAARGYLAALYGAEQDWPGAAVEIDKARRSLRNHIQHVLSAESENEQLAFLRTKDQRWLHAALTVAVQAGGDPRVNPLAVGWVLNGKGVTPEVLGQRPVLARQLRGDPKVQQLYQQLQDVRDELAARSLRTVPASGRDDEREEKLLGREASLSRDLGLALQNALTDASWVDVAEVQRVLRSDKALAGDAVLIDIARFTMIDFQAAGSEPAGSEAHYLACVVPPEGPAKIVDLGPARVIDPAIRKLQDTMALAIHGANGKGKGTLLKLGEKESEELYRQASAELGGLLLGKLYPYAGQYQRWVVSPDADLWLVPWAALVLPAGDKAGSYAVEKHTISLVSSGRNLVARRPRGIRRSAALLFADADYGDVPEKADSDLLFGALEYSAAEADAVLPFLKKYTGGDPVVKTGREAREQVFRSAVSPQAVVLSTHGFFLDGKGQDVAVNPFLRCGLAFAGANLRADAGRRGARDASGRAAQDDGVLFGLEILDTDLRGTDLVVLSACDTALGRVRGGEGVANLQSAFQLAGAQTVVGTLWEVPDKQTAKLMRDFFRHLADDRLDKAAALRQAQLDRIKERRAGTGRAAHPFFWAALTMTGQWARTLDE
jgi:CHAT domain-containing protein/tetratricopeptide (TPR) repeat protein